MWSPETYQRFQSERRQPFDDLVTLVTPRPAMRILDLGCGTGELTAELHMRFGANSTVGIDSSAAMLAKAAELERAGLHFEQREITAVEGGPFDLIISNAAIHWVPEHEQLITRLTTLLAPGGQLAIQMPANDPHASHRIAAELALELNLAPRPATLLEPEAYATLLHRLGFTSQHVRMQIYGHLLDATEDVIEWNRGALLTHYAAQVEDFAPFLAAYRERLLRELGDARPFFYTYRRLFIYGAR